MAFIFMEELMDLIKYYFIYRGILRAKTASFKRTVITAVIMVIYLLLFSFVFMEDISVVKKIVVLLMTLILFEGRFKNKLMIYPVVFFLVGSIDTIIMVVSGYVLHKSPLLYLDDRYSVGYLVSTFLLIPVLVMINEVSRKGNHESILEKEIPVIQYWLFMGTLVGLLFMIILFFIYIYYGKDNIYKIRNFYFLLLMSVFCTIICVISLYSYVLRLGWKTQVQRIKLDAYRQYNEAQMQYYKILKKHNEEVRGYRHDMRHHLTLLQIWSRERNTQQIDEYIDNLLNRELLIGKGYIFQTGNQVVDVVLNGVVAGTDTDDIQITCQGHLPPKISMEDMDLCGLIANATENAIEAAHKSRENAFVDISFKVWKQKFVFIIKNSYDCGPNGIRKGFISTKDGKEHGYGMRNIKLIVEKYNGLIRSEIKSDEVQLCVIIDCIKY